MKLVEIINASQVLRKIATADLPLKKAYQVAMLIDKVNPHLSFFDSKQKEIMSKPEELNELLNLEVELDYTPLTLPLDSNIQLSPMDIMLVKPFITFEEGEQQ